MWFLARFAPDLPYDKRKILRAATALFLLTALALPANTALAAAEASMTDASGALLVEATTQQPLLEQDADTPRSVAGLIKLPAVLVLSEAADQGKLDLNSEIAVSDKAAGVGGPTAFIEGGEVISAAPLMKAAVMICAGDAITALGESLFGTETGFVDAINARLNELGVPVTYDNAVGAGAQLTPRQLAVIGAALMKSPTFTAHSKLTLENFTHSDGRDTELVNANRMLRSYAGCTGVATGSSQSDGYCGVFAVTRGDTQLICVVTGCRNSSTRFAVASSMLDQAFATKKAQKCAEKGEVIAESVRVHGGKRREVNLVAKDSVVLLLDKAEPALVAVENIPEQLQAPLGLDSVVGDVSYQTADGVEMGKVELVPQVEVEEAFFREIIRQLLLSFMRL
ncbi:MAG TPA: serine hydrolase [Feifaniaceae bacterium]|nr:serine hydrolase [Feifaniaceae bacterium]